MSKIDKAIMNAVKILTDNNNVREDFKLYIPKDSKKLIRYLDERGFEKEIGDTVVYTINKGIL